ncbi:MAG: aspartate ammonia-lyase [Flavobacteriaceae bacterium]|nr:MAG: aspartate ammonia-lyase [Flavobacteriaceae bacterium]
MKLTKQLSGVAGEYYVAAELSRRGYLAAITLRSSDGVDILVSNTEGDKLVSIQVKTTQNKLKWILTKKIEKEISENKYFVFVNIPSDINQPPLYRIINSKTLSKHIYIGHRSWLNEPGKNGKIRNDSDIRQFDPKYFNEDDLLSWDDLIQQINLK